MLYSLFEEIWEKEEIPAEWKEGYLIKIPKKGDLSRCDNYRGITFLSVPGKVLDRIILERMKGKVDQTMREEQAGFRQDRSFTDCNTADHSGTIHRMELIPIHQLC